MPKLNAEQATPTTTPKITPKAKKTAPEPLIEAEPVETPGAVDEFGFYTLEDTEDKLNVLYYGREGSGKTTNALDMANLGRILVINVEGGIKKSALAKRGIKTENVVLWPAPGQRVTFDGFHKLYEKVRTDLADDPQAWIGVVIDSATELATVFRENATKSRQEDLDRAGRSYDPNFIDRSDYGVQTDQAQRLIRKFRDLPCHFVITALERYDEDAQMSGPAMNPALAQAVLGYVDFVLFAKATQSSAVNDEEYDTEFRASTRSGSKWRAKDRFDVTPRVLATPTFTRLLGYVDGTLDENTDELQAEFNQRQLARTQEIEAAKAEKEAAKAKRRTTRRTTTQKTDQPNG